MNHVNILVENFEPFVNVTKHENGTVEFTGYMKVVLSNLVKYMNFSYSLMVSQERTFGKKQDNGSWTGMFGMLQRDVMLGLILCFLLVTLVGKLVTILLFEIDVGVRYWTVVEIFFQKGTSSMPRSNSGRFLVIGWVLATFVLITAISSALTSLLSVAGRPKYIKTLEDLPNFPNTKVILPQGSATTKYVENSPDPIMKYIWRSVERRESQIMHPENFTNDWVLGLVASQAFVIMKNVEELRSILRDLSRKSVDQSCTHYDISEPIRFISLTLAFRKGLPEEFIKKVNEIISWTVDTSYLRFIDPGVDIEYRRCLHTVDGEDTEEPLGFSLFKAPLLLLAGGCVTSALLLIMEFLKPNRIAPSPSSSNPTCSQLEKYRQENNGSCSPCVGAQEILKQREISTKNMKDIEKNLKILMAPAIDCTKDFVSPNK